MYVQRCEQKIFLNTESLKWASESALSIKNSSQFCAYFYEPIENKSDVASGIYIILRFPSVFNFAMFSHLKITHAYPKDSTLLVVVEIIT